MDSIENYQTLSGRSEGIYKEKGSKFIGIAAPCYSEQEAKAHLDTWKKEHHGARHLCYAYRFGEKMDIVRSNDDGEPSNSAGAPILGQIQSFELTNVLVGVVRYYGGTKLGVGGLINAYRTAAKEAILNGELVVKELESYFALYFDYAQMPAVMNEIKWVDATIHSQEFEESCKLLFSVPVGLTAFISEKLAQIDGINFEKKEVK